MTWLIHARQITAAVSRRRWEAGILYGAASPISRLGRHQPSRSNASGGRDDKHRFMHAFPNTDNAPSNAICRKLGFELLGAREFEFPKGHIMTCNDWRLDLRA
jgi:hypothetical protein